MRVFVILTLFFTKEVLSCQWVCIDKKNNIKKHYFDKNKLKVEYSVPIIDVPAITGGEKKRNLGPPEVILRMPDVDVEPLEDFCNNKEFSRMVKEINRKTKCVPRDTIVNIVYKDGKVMPNKITTKLCRGVCGGSKTCLSDGRRNVSLAVRTITHDGQIHCSTISIPEDTKCKCDCDTNQSNCLETQTFDKKFCKCKCVNDREYYNCMNKSSHVWKKETCTCVCENEKVCTTGTIWNKNTCKCVRVIT